MDRLTGDEHFSFEGVPINRLLNDFWSWQASDLLVNSVRGALAEYIVATALDVDNSYRANDWHEYDLEYRGKKIEVKSSAYLQSWERNKLSRICFNIYPSRPFTASVWDNNDIRRHSDAYVFCLFKSVDRGSANPMLLEQWDFFVVKTSDIDKSLGVQRTASLSTLASLPHIKCSYDVLRSAVDRILDELAYHDESKSGGNTSSNHLKSERDWVLIEDHHPAIIDPERQARIIGILEENRRSNRRSAKTYTRKNTHIFAGLLYCGYCGGQMQATVDRERADGYRPSIYACSRKRRFSDCGNKYVSDVTVAPFVLNYIANILKAQNNFGKSTPLDTFERKLLRGEMFSGVDHIEQVGLIEMYDMLKRGNLSDAVYSSRRVQDAADQIAADERDLLAAEKRKKERALARLKSLYLYSEDAISERDFLIEQKALNDAIGNIDKRLEEIERNSASHFSLSDDEFMAKASVFIMTHQLQGKRFIDFEKMVRQIDPQVIKEFVRSIIQKIVIKDGRVLSIRFKNGLEHKFLYKDA